MNLEHVRELSFLPLDRALCARCSVELAELVVRDLGQAVEFTSKCCGAAVKFMLATGGVHWSMKERELNVPLNCQLRVFLFEHCEKQTEADGQ